MIEIIFLSILALIWIIFATVQDIKIREVQNWINFSLIIFALAFRFLYSLFNGGGSFNFFFQGVIGLVIFFVLGNLLYYGRIFGGGDAKLMYALGPILTISESFIINIKILLIFVLLFLLFGGIYGLISSIVLSLKNSKNFKKEFSKNMKVYRKAVYFLMALGLIIMILGLFFHNLIFYFGILVFILPYFHLFAKSVDEACMIKKIKTSNLREGDLLYQDVNLGNKIIKKNWNGLTKLEIREIKKKSKFVLIKEGIAFVPAFLISFIVLEIFYFTGILEVLWNSFW